ncbi:hypothetical protein HMPREF0239_05026 [Clostridium sp. ATCC BAA-442]|nr:hypothetical protein HMPREF0239_05026 [Clostridium sp. ATCC BAA-442]
MEMRPAAHIRLDPEKKIPRHMSPEFSSFRLIPPPVCGETLIKPVGLFKFQSAFRSRLLQRERESQ